MNYKLTPLLVHNPFHFDDFLSWVSTIQRNFCGSFFNHGAILYEDLITGEKFIIEAVSHGVHKISLEKYLSYSKDRVLYSFKTNNNSNIDFLLAQVGKKYQFSIWWSHIGYALFKKMFGKDDFLTNWFNTYNNPNKWFCFELIDKTFNLNLGPGLTGKDFEDNFIVNKIIL
jgi:hypothetical protein